MKKIQSALISVFNKEGLEPLLEVLKANGVKFYSTGGTQSFMEGKGYEVQAVESITNYPSIFGGRVKTLHPAVFGGILYRRDNETDLVEKSQHDIPAMDLVIVDLYPFEETVASGASHEDIIEKIDIGGISLIRAAAKNYKDVVILSNRNQYADLVAVLKEQEGATSIEQRKHFALKAFDESSHYDSMIFNYFNRENESDSFKISIRENTVLRYGENPHQKGRFYGNSEEVFEKKSGKEISYNNLVDLEGAVALLEEFEEPSFVIVKHTNACGTASAETVLEAYQKALEADPVSAFGGILACNRTIDLATAKEINNLFYEILVAPDFDQEAYDLLTSKKNRILVKQVKPLPGNVQFKSMINGVLVQDKDKITDNKENLKIATEQSPSEQEIEELLFASKVCKHTKSNAIVLVKGKQLIASGVGQTSRVDALKQAILKAKSFGFDLNGAVLASDAFFPFADSVELAHKEGIKAVIQPGGSVKDQDSIDYCNSAGMSMVFTGTRHFKH